MISGKAAISVGRALSSPCASPMTICKAAFKRSGRFSTRPLIKAVIIATPPATNSGVFSVILSATVLIMKNAQLMSPSELFMIPSIRAKTMSTPAVKISGRLSEIVCTTVGTIFSDAEEINFPMP